MKILIINSRYFISAGPERYMFNITEVLKKHGHDVIPFSIRNIKNIKTKYNSYFAEPIGNINQVYFEDYNIFNPKTFYQILERQFYSFHVKKRLEKLIRKEKPDIAYILHHYNKLSPSIIDACRKYNIPTIMRLSDFFLICPESHLLRNSKPCEECIDKSLWNSVRHKCVKGSFIPSLIKACSLSFHRLIRIYEKLDYIISPSKFTIQKVNRILKKNIVHIPTLTKIQKKPNSHIGDYALFVGRVEEEKGLLFAVKAFKGTHYKLKIVGSSHSGYDKFLKKYIEKNNMKNVELISFKSGKDLEDLYKNSRFLLFPVVW